ncbi:MAG: hypothetical protein RJQ10_08195 [Haliea sp.]
MTKLDGEYTGLGFDPDAPIERSREKRDMRLCPDVNDKYAGSTP